MKGIITSYRRSRHVQYPEQVLIKIEGVKNEKEAVKFLGKKVKIDIPKLIKIQGKIIAIHGKNGVLRARFRKGLPGQVIGKECEIVG